jgi:hypothetical protein
MMPLQPRQRILLLLLAAAALAALASAGPERAADTRPADEPASPAAVPAAVRSQAAPLARIDEPGRAFQVQPLPEALDAFQTRSWQPPPPAPKPAPVVKPTAPPLPFAYLGRIEEVGATTVYLRRGEDVVLAQPKKEIDANYRLEEVTADRLVFLYLPLQQQQVLPLGVSR